MRNDGKFWLVFPTLSLMGLVAIGAYIAHDPESIIQAAPTGPILPVDGLRVELLKTQDDFVETLVSGDNLTGCDANGDLLCDGADIQAYVTASLDTD